MGFWRFWGGFEGFWKFLRVFKVNITIVAIIFPNHRDQLFSDVCIILRFLGVFEGFWRFWVFSRSFGGFGWVFGGFGGFLRGLLGFGGFSR